MQTLDFSTNSADEAMSAAIPRLIDAAVASFDADPDIARRYLMRASALLCVRREVLKPEQPEASGRLLSWQLNRVVDYIEAHLAEKITAADLASLINVSKGRLSRAFKISVGDTPSHYIVRRRVELACTIMRTTRESLSQVAIGCGLCDQAHLCKVFRSILGVTPSAWRRAALDCADTRVLPASWVNRTPKLSIGPAL
jgi:transcriptional regulator GlxA family with amidase domain